MIKAYNGFEAKKSGSGFESLPAGGYVAKIIGAKPEEKWNRNVLTIAFDIAEGEYAGWFKKNYDANTNEDKWWSGTYSVDIPTGEEEAWKRRAFENLIACAEESNPGYHWDWNEAALKGKRIGVLFGNVERQSKAGNLYWATVCGGTASVDDVLEGTYKLPKDRPYKGKPAVGNAIQPNVSANDFSEISDDDGEVPF